MSKLQPKLRNHKTNTNARTGAMLPLIAVTMVVLFIACVIGIDIARIHVTNSELRTASDAAARAGVEALGRLQNRQDAEDAAIAIAQLNRVAGNGLVIQPADIQFGISTPQTDGTFVFTAGGSNLNAVKVLGDPGDVNTMFGAMLGKNSYHPTKVATATRLDRDIALVLDVSGSMGRDGRFSALKNGVKVFFDQLNSTAQKEQVSLTVYETNPRKKVAMTSNLELINNALIRERVGGRTGIGRGLRVGLNSIENDPNVRRFALKSIIVMTDGKQNEGVEPDIVADECADAGIVVHTLTFSSGANQTLMKTVASKTGGIHLHARNDNELKDGFKTIAQTIQVLLTE